MIAQNMLTQILIELCAFILSDTLPASVSIWLRFFFRRLNGGMWLIQDYIVFCWRSVVVRSIREVAQYLAGEAIGAGPA